MKLLYSNVFYRDESDAEFVDVIHTNALVQGKMERCGHVDFYLNGGILQPGCTGFGLSKYVAVFGKLCHGKK